MDEDIDDAVAVISSPSKRVDICPARPKFVDRPTCSKCKRAWRWPRNLAYVNMDPGPPDRIKPTTQATVVAFLTGLPDTSPRQPTMKTAIFQKIEVTHTCAGFPYIPNKLVKEFEYHTDSGDVRYDPASQSRDGYAFARLVTLNTWYVELHHCLISVALGVLDHYANFTMALSLYTDSTKSEEFYTTKHVFLCGWLGMIALNLAFASYLALREWRIKASPYVGDLIVHCNWVDLLRTYLAMVFFTFFVVDNRIKDVVIRLHPWKSIQPFAAIKANGTRAYAIGYMDKCLFRVENRTGQFFNLFFIQVLKTSIFAYKVYISIWQPALISIASSVSSVGSVALGWYIWQNLWSDRRKLWQKLQNIMRTDPTPETEEYWKRQRLAAKKLLSLHFGQSLNEVRPKSPTTLFGNVCKCCGRDNATADPATSTKGQPCVGDTVRLVENFAQYHDAKYGPMQPGDVGKIVEVGPEIAHIGSRCLVAVDTCNGPAQYWYDDGAIEVLGSVDDTKAVSLIPKKEDTLPFLAVNRPSPHRAIGATAAANSDTDGALMREFADLLKRMRQRPPESQQRFAGELVQSSKAMLQESPAPSVSHTPAGDRAVAGGSLVEVFSETSSTNLPGSL